MKVINEIEVYEVDGDKEATCDPVKIKSHWVFEDRVILIIGGHEYTVSADDMKRAIDNATNVR